MARYRGRGHIFFLPHQTFEGCHVQHVQDRLYGVALAKDGGYGPKQLTSIAERFELEPIVLQRFMVGLQSISLGWGQIDQYWFQ